MADEMFKVILEGQQEARAEQRKVYEQIQKAQQDGQENTAKLLKVALSAFATLRNDIDQQLQQMRQEIETLKDRIPTDCNSTIVEYTQAKNQQEEMKEQALQATLVRAAQHNICPDKATRRRREELTAQIDKIFQEPRRERSRDVIQIQFIPLTGYGTITNMYSDVEECKSNFSEVKERVAEHVCVEEKFHILDEEDRLVDWEAVTVGQKFMVVSDAQLLGPDTVYDRLRSHRKAFDEKEHTPAKVMRFDKKSAQWNAYSSNRLEGTSLSYTNTLLVAETLVAQSSEKDAIVAEVYQKISPNDDSNERLRQDLIATCNHLIACDCLLELPLGSYVASGLSELHQLHCTIADGLRHVDDARTGYDQNVMVGRFRNLPVRVGGKTTGFACPRSIDARVHEFLLAIHSGWMGLKMPPSITCDCPYCLGIPSGYACKPADTSSVEFVAWCVRIFVRFEHIHPYEDGNGRVGRVLLNKLLRAGGWPMVSYRFSTTCREAYMWAVGKAQHGDDHPLISLTVQGLLRAYDGWRMSEEEEGGEPLNKIPRLE